jgi:hypothetical protein
MQMNEITVLATLKERVNDRNQGQYGKTPILYSDRRSCARSEGMNAPGWKGNTKSTAHRARGAIAAAVTDASAAVRREAPPSVDYVRWWLVCIIVFH